MSETSITSGKTVGKWLKFNNGDRSQLKSKGEIIGLYRLFRGWYTYVQQKPFNKYLPNYHLTTTDPLEVRLFTRPNTTI